MFKLVNVQRNEITPSKVIQCQVAAYKDGAISDTEFFPDVVDSIQWAAGNAHWADKFEIYNENWDYKIIGEVDGNNTITWGDHSLN